MNLALHGFLLQVFLSIPNFHNGRLLCSAGEPGYLDFDNLPETNFSCQGKVIGGYYADVEAGCQMFHVCTIGQKDEIMDIKFLCLNGTVFDQETRVCERVDEVDCSRSERFYNLNLELYGNNAVTLSLHEDDDDDLDDLSDSVEDHQLRTTSARPSTTSTTSTTTSRPSTTAASGSFQHPAGYPQHYQPQPPFPQVHTSQSKSLYDDKNGGYHHQYIFHSGERANNQATSYQLFSNQGVSSTTVPPQPQIHQIRFSSTVSPQIIHNEPSTVTPLFHATSSTIQTLLNSNANSPALINPIFHNHGIASTTEQFAVHSNNPRETSDYRDEDDHELEVLQQANKGKISKLISSVSNQQESSRVSQTRTSQTSHQQRISSNFLPTPASVETTARTFYPTPRSSPKPSQSQSHSVTHHVTQHIHVSPGVTIPQLKPHQITINLPPPDIQRIVQNPSPLLPSQSRVIVTAKASVSDESGRPLNTTQLVTLPLPTIPVSYDDYKEGDESFDPFYRDVPKIRKNRWLPTRHVENARFSRGKRSLDQIYHYIHGADSRQQDDLKATQSEPPQNRDNAMNEKENTRAKIDDEDFQAIRESLIKFRDILFSDEVDEDSIRSIAEIIAGSTERTEKDSGASSVMHAKQAENNAIKKLDSLEDLKTEASKHLTLNKEEEKKNENEKKRNEEASYDNLNIETNTEKVINEERIEHMPTAKSLSKLEINTQPTTARSEQNESREGVIDVIILDFDDLKRRLTSTDSDAIVETSKTDAPIEIIFEEETKSGSRDITKTNEKIVNNAQVAGYLTRDESKKRPSSAIDEEQLEIPQEATKRKDSNDSRERKSGSRRKSSRSRSSRRRISSKIKQQRADHVEVTEAISQAEEKDEITTATTAATTTMMTTIPTVIPITTTTISSVTLFEEKATEQIGSHLFDEPESQTSKEVDTRAIDTSYSKSLRDSKSHDANKGKEMERSFDHQVRKGHVRNLEQRESESEEEQETESMDIQTASSEDTNFTENSQSTEEAVTREITNFSEEEQSFAEEFTEYETSEDESTVEVNGEEIEESSRERNKISSSRKTAISSKNNWSQEEASYHEDKNDRSSVPTNDDSNEERRSATRSNEETNSEESNEYQDATDSSTENTYDINTQEDYKESGSTEDFTVSADYTNSDEYTESQENVTGSIEETEDSTEGVLKFTDELPKSDDKEDVETFFREMSTPDESDEHDYIDDNYEPENYKQPQSVSKFDSLEEKSERSDKENKDVDVKDPNHKESIETHLANEKDDTQTKHIEAVTEVVDLKEVANSKATSSTTEMTTSTITTTTSTTTPRPTTTTSRSTPPRLFKPVSARRTYAFIPPTTTPNPVVIKPRLGLFNPKPAKPPKSYNELAPKPVIRKLPLLSRTTTIPTTVMDNLNVQDRGTTMEPATTTMTTTTTTTEMPTTISTYDDIMITTITTEPATTTTTTTTESGRSEENTLEIKLEAKDHESTSPDLSAKSDATDKKDQLSSPSEQNSPSNSTRDADSWILDKEILSFTPYPISRLSTLAPSVEQTTKEAESKRERETTESVGIIVTPAILPTMLPTEKSEYAETSTDNYPAETTATTARVPQQNTLAILSEHPTTVSPFTTVSSTTEDVHAFTESMVFRPIKRRIIPRRHMSFNCLEKEMYRFYGDVRDCRLFHYCSPGFTTRQVLDFRFVCEEGTAFDEATQSCRHEVRNRKCRKRS